MAVATADRRLRPDQLPYAKVIAGAGRQPHHCRCGAGEPGGAWGQVYLIEESEPMPEVTDPNEPEPLETKRDYPVEGYWRVVGDTVSDVFHGDPDGVRRARERVRKSAPGTQ